MYRLSVVRSLLLFLLASFVILSVGCGNDNSNANPGNSKPGTMGVQTVSPAAAATCVGPSTKILITFSMAADPTTVNDKNIQVTDQSKAAVAGIVTYDVVSNTATFTPSAVLVSNANYTVTVTGVSSSTGVAMSSPFTSTFTTGPCATGQAQYQASLFNAVQENVNHGQISVDTAGVVTTHLTGATASTTYKLQFCPAPGQNYTCFDVGDVTTDGSGNADTTISFPKSGSWAGDFHINSGGTTQFQTDLVPNGSGQVYSATLQPGTTTNGNGVFMNGAPGPQDPLSGGTVTFSNGMMQFQLKGAATNTTYTTSECPLFFGSSCYQLYDSNQNGGLTTDSSGNGSISLQPDGVPGDIFGVSPPPGRSGFVSGFKVP